MRPYLANDRQESPSAFPADRDVVELRKNVKLAPPKGAEFGKTEVFYLTVRAENHARAVALNEAIFKQLRARFQELRNVKAESMVEELTKTVRLAKADLEQATAALRSAEHRVGADLGELRSMQDLATSDTRPAAQRRRVPRSSARTPRRRKPIENCWLRPPTPKPIPADSWRCPTGCWSPRRRCAG